jgi:leucyl aminopeptidase
MPQVVVSARRGAFEDTDADTRVVGLFEGESLEDPLLQMLVDLGEAKGTLRSVAVAHQQDEEGRLRRIILAGLGERGEFDLEKARVAAASAASRGKTLGAKALSWAVPEGGGLDGEQIAAALVEGTLLQLYSFDRFKSSGDEAAEGSDRGAPSDAVAGEDAAGEERTGPPDLTDEASSTEQDGIARLEVVGRADLSHRVERARVVAEAQNAARDLQNLPSNFATPLFLAERAGEVAEAHASLSLEVLDFDDIVERGMGAFAAVAQGTYTPARLIVLRYDGSDRGAHLGFVGKAVTFDTGGISIKPAAKMHEMKFDMSGGAAVIEALGAIATLGVPARITGVVPATENMPSGRSVKPGDIVTAMNGKTIEVNNTDAEGRLILSDALCYAVEQGAERIVDLATLTGAIITTFGNTHAGLFSNDDDWCAAVQAACEATGEIGWRLPLHPEYFELTKGKYADLTNAATERKASSIYAAEFLRQFVDKRPWVHIDIAGTAWGMSRAYVANGASGFGVRTLVELARATAA